MKHYLFYGLLLTGMAIPFSSTVAQQSDTGMTNAVHKGSQMSFQRESYLTYYAGKKPKQYYSFTTSFSEEQLNKGCKKNDVMHRPIPKDHLSLTYQDKDYVCRYVTYIPTKETMTFMGCKKKKVSWFDQFAR